VKSNATAEDAEVGVRNQNQFNREAAKIAKADAKEMHFWPQI